MNNNKIALVTGASRKVGIGAAIARELAQDGVDIFITYFRPYDKVSGLAGSADEPHNLIAEIQQLGRSAAGLEIDLSDANAPQTLFNHVEETFGPYNLTPTATQNRHFEVPREIPFFCHKGDFSSKTHRNDARFLLGSPKNPPHSIKSESNYATLAASTTATTSGKSIFISFNFSTVGTLLLSQPRRL